jgi:hypothetical protein
VQHVALGHRHLAFSRAVLQVSLASA